MDGTAPHPNAAAVGRFTPNCTAVVLRKPTNVKRNNEKFLMEVAAK